MLEYPFPIPWHDDLARLQFGVETEHFLFREARPASQNDINELFAQLRSEGFQPGPCDGDSQLRYMWRPTKAGPVVLKTDYCTHIVEGAFPPVTDVGLFCSLYDEYWRVLNGCVRTLGLRILPGAVLSDVPDVIFFATDPDDGERLRRLNERSVTLGPYGHQYCFAAMAATQVHLNILDSQFYARLPMLYQMEYLVPLLFSNGQNFRGRYAYSVRPLLYRDSFDASWLACGVPQHIPDSPAAYQAMVDSNGEFVRDYSFICPSRHGTVEFRSACSQTALSKIVELIALRAGTVWAARRGLVTPWGSSRELFYHTCETGQPPQDVVQRDLATLKLISGELPDPLDRSLCRAVQRAESLCAVGTCHNDRYEALA